MNFRQILVPLAGLLLLGFAYKSFGWAGVALVTGGIVMFLLLHFNRAMSTLKKAADLPVGFVPSAVMLNARLKPGVTLLHVVAMTRALGEQRSPKDEQPEIFRWTDSGNSWVECTFVSGKLKSWALTRPEQEPDAPAAGATPVDQAALPSATRNP